MRWSCCNFWVGFYFWFWIRLEIDECRWNTWIRFGLLGWFSVRSAQFIVFYFLLGCGSFIVGYFPYLLDLCSFGHYTCQVEYSKVIIHFLTCRLVFHSLTADPLIDCSAIAAPLLLLFILFTRHLVCNALESGAKLILVFLLRSKIVMRLDQNIFNTVTRILASNQGYCVWIYWVMIRGCFLYFFWLKGEVGLSLTVISWNS